MRTPSTCRSATIEAPGLADLLAPILLGVHIRVFEAGRRRADRGGAVQVGVDQLQLLVVVCVGAWVIERIGVIHAGVQVRPRLVLVSQAPVVPDLLADHVLPVRLRVAVDGIRQVRVVHLGRALGDMAASDPNLGQAKPAVGAVGVVVGVHLAFDAAAASAGLVCVAACFFDDVQY